MRRRLYFMLPNLDSAKRTRNDLLLACIENRHMHFLGTRDMELGELNEASVLQKSDIVHGTGIGMMMGAVGGFLFGLLVLFSPPDGVTIRMITVLLTTLVGAGFGAWASSLVASSIPNSKLRIFESDIAAGKILMMVDVPSGKLEKIREMLMRQHPEASSGGMDAMIPAFP